MKRHASEDCFGVQVAGGYADTMSLTSRVRMLCVACFMSFLDSPRNSNCADELLEYFLFLFAQLTNCFSVDFSSPADSGKRSSV